MDVAPSGSAAAQRLLCGRAVRRLIRRGNDEPRIFPVAQHWFAQHWFAQHWFAQHWFAQHRFEQHGFE